MPETRLAGGRCIVGAGCPIADVTSSPWVEEARVATAEPLGDVLASSPAIADWLARVGERPAVRKGMRVLEG